MEKFWYEKEAGIASAYRLLNAGHEYISAFIVTDSLDDVGIHSQVSMILDSVLLGRLESRIAGASLECFQKEFRLNEKIEFDTFGVPNYGVLHIEYFDGLGKLSPGSAIWTGRIDRRSVYRVRTRYFREESGHIVIEVGVPVLATYERKFTSEVATRLLIDEDESKRNDGIFSFLSVVESPHFGESELYSYYCRKFDCFGQLTCDDFSRYRESRGDTWIWPNTYQRIKSFIDSFAERLNAASVEYRGTDDWDWREDEIRDAKS